MKKIIVNMAQMNKWVVNQDNVRWFNSIQRNNGIVISLSLTPYIDWLRKFGISYSIE